MRNEDRKEVLKYARDLLQWIVGLDPLNEDETNELRQVWENFLLRPPTEEGRIKQMWQQVVDTRAHIVAGA